MKIAGKAAFRGAFLFLLFFTSNGYIYASDYFSMSGRLSVEGVLALDPKSTREDPSLTARVKTNWQKSQWSIHSWIEGGWDGTVRSPRKDFSILKNFRDVYQDNTPYVEAKELYLERSIESIDLRLGLQRFSWGRLDEYPVNDLFNPWDYTRFIVRPLEDRKIGVPSVSAALNKADWTYQLVWVPWLVPYRLPKPNERWSTISAGAALSDIPNAEVIAKEPDLPARTIENGSAGLRIQKMGDIEWALNLFHGFDPRPVFKTTALRVEKLAGQILIDPGFIPTFHKITSIGADGAWARGNWSLRGETAYAFNRAFDIRQELWGYPSVPVPGLSRLNPIQIESDTLDYGLAADYRLGDFRFFEDSMLTLQAQQRLIVERPDTLYDRRIETLLWANLKSFWMNQKIEANINLAFNPEHGSSMLRPSAYYVFNDSLKAGILGLVLSGPPQSIFGSYDRNDQIELVLILSW